MQASLNSLLIKDFFNPFALSEECVAFVVECERTPNFITKKLKISLQNIIQLIEFKIIDNNIKLRRIL